MPEDSKLSLVDLEFDKVHGLHDAVSFLPQLRQETYVLDVIAVDVTN